MCPVRQLRSPATLLLLIYLTASLGAAAVSASGPPAGLHYSGRVDIDPATGSLKADLLVAGLELAAGQEELGFLLNGALEVETLEGAGVASYDAAPLATGAEWSRVAVRFDPAPEERNVELRFVYSGAPTMPDNGINQISEDWVELSVDAAWHPVIETVDREFTADLDIGLPENWTLVASGEATVVDGRYLLDSRILHADVAFVAAPGLTRVSGDGFELYDRGAPEETRTAILRTAAACRDALDARFSARATLPTGRFVLTDRAEGGYARKNFIALTDVTESSDVRLTNFLCHELAHFWSSGAKPLTVDNWLNEGFAVFVAAETTRTLHGDEAFQSLVEDWRERAADQPSIWTPADQGRRPFEVNYKKAPLALLSLQDKVGVEVFDAWLTQYMTEPIDDTPRLLEALEEHAGAEAREWFEATLSR